MLETIYKKNKLVSDFKNGLISEEKFLLESYSVGMTMEDTLQEGLFSDIGYKVKLKKVINECIDQIIQKYLENLNLGEKSFVLSTESAKNLYNELNILFDSIRKQIEDVK